MQQANHWTNYIIYQILLHYSGEIDGDEVGLKEGFGDGPVRRTDGDDEGFFVGLCD